MSAALVVSLAGCGEPLEPSTNDVAGGETQTTATTSADESSSDESSADASSTADTQTDTGDTDTESNCPAPTEPPMLVDDPEVWCSVGFEYDATYQLCASASEAIGPFPPAMVAACLECGGIDCESNRWPVDQARGLRGTQPCWPGTSELASICVDDLHAWGPFTPGMVADCKQAGGGEITCESMRWDRDFAENLLPPALGLDWVWILPLDLGLRDDPSGGGAFSAPRFNNPGGHSGIDVLAPVGTPLLAPCSGPVLTGYDGGYGNYVQLSCELPPVLAQGQTLWVSILVAHLDSIDAIDGDDVAVGDSLGTVGKTGNAAGVGINPHVHYEIALHSSLSAAQAESHASSDHSGNAAGDSFEPLLTAACLDELGFQPIDGPVMKGRRVDPFMLMSCLSSDKPTLESPDPALQVGLTPWSDHYDAVEFDVDVGL